MERCSLTNWSARAAVGKMKPRVLGLLATYHREDLARALGRATRYRAFSWSAVERILGSTSAPTISMGFARGRSAGTLDEILRQDPYRLAPRRSINRCWTTRRWAMKKTTTQLRDECLSHCATLGIPLEPAALMTSCPGRKRKICRLFIFSTCSWELRPMPA